MSLRVAWTVDLAYWTDIPLTVDVNMLVTRMVAGERGIDRHAVDSSRGIYFMTEFNMLEGQLSVWEERGGGSRGRGLRVGRCSQFPDIAF